MQKYPILFCFLTLLILGIWIYERVSTDRLKTRTNQLQNTLAKTAETEPYLVIDTTNNRLYIRKAERVVLEAVCSTGSGKVLHGSGKQAWVFRTPQGLLGVKGKFANPIWIKPAWAFIEEGNPVPDRSFVEARYDSTALGDYALALGNGYFIHGTLYTAFLGESITHGCIRLGDADLKQVYATAREGTRVYIY